MAPSFLLYFAARLPSRSSFIRIVRDIISCIKPGFLLGLSPVHLDQYGEEGIIPKLFDQDIVDTADTADTDTAETHK